MIKKNTDVITVCLIFLAMVQISALNVIVDHWMAFYQLLSLVLFKWVENGKGKRVG